MIDKRVINEWSKIMDEVNERNNFAEIYARYDNRLAVELDSDNWDECEFLKGVVEIMEMKIIGDFMERNGYYRNDNDDWKRWTKES